VAETRPRRPGRLALLVLAAFALTATLALVLAACGGGSSSSGADPLVGYWMGAAKGSQMTMVQIHKDGDTYTVLSNPNRKTGDAKKEGDALVVDTHVVTMTFTAKPQDKLDLQFTGEMFKQPVHTTLSRVDETQYKDGAVAYGLVVLRRGLAMWKAGGGRKYPPASEVTPSGMLSQMIAWPVNLFSNSPMVPEASTGNFTYAPTQGGKSYSLKGYLSDGSTLGK
jgi:hypothetical protein